jgi:HD-GYP domain-containing protein (c-di-GMP phosphodiesterase class II)
VLSEAIIRKLYDMGFSYLSIQEPGTEDIYAEQPLDDDTMIAVHGALSRLFTILSSTCKDDEGIPVTIAKQFERAAELIVRDLKDGRNYAVPVFFGGPFNYGHREKAFIEHAVNVCVYSVKFGMLDGCSEFQLKALALGALLHDAGKLGQAQNGAGELGQHDWTFRSYRLIKESGLPVLAAQYALFHLERNDGRRGLSSVTGDPSLRLAKWIGLMDWYETLTSGREGIKPLPPSETLEILYAGAGTHFDIDMVCKVRDHIAAYPPGLTVLLSSGEIGVVSRLKPENRQRPVVRIFREADGRLLHEPYELDLSRQLDVMIESIELDGTEVLSINNEGYIERMCVQ